MRICLFVFNNLFDFEGCLANAFKFALFIIGGEEAGIQAVPLVDELMGNPDRPPPGICSGRQPLIHVNNLSVFHRPRQTVRGTTEAEL